MPDTPTLKANKIHVTYRASLLQLAEAIAPYPFLRKKENELRAVADNLQSPFNVAIFGRMKTGKSSLINALIGRALAITGVEEATATINRLSYATDERLLQFTVHWQDAQPETLPLERLQQEWSGKTPEVLERIGRAAWLELYSDAPALRDIHITDTPGTGATAEEHEVIAKQFINGQTADALLYVFSPTGRESDEADLAAFRAGCLPGSSLDNSVAVLHKWDHIYWDEDNWDSIITKARRVRRCMNDLVSAVIPVSAPLALMAKTAPMSFWQSCASILKTFDCEDDLIETLKDEEEWEDEAPREALYKQAKTLGCPLSSFRIMLRHLYRHPNEKPAATIYQLSGLEELESLLDRQIFSMRSVIQQKQNCARARKILNTVDKSIREKLANLENNMGIMAGILSLLKHKGSESQRMWLESQLKTTQEERGMLEQAHLQIDELRSRTKDWVDSITNAYDLIPWLKQYEKLGLDKKLAEKCIAYLKLLMRTHAQIRQSEPDNDILDIITNSGINRLRNSPIVEDKDKADKLVDCLMQCI